MSSPSTPPALPDIACGRLSLADYAHNFADAHPPLSAVQARLEAERCYYCFDAPCTTGIDIPTFIARIAQGNLRGAAHSILEENILGGMCARVCPTEVLCEQACVRNAQEDKPVEIGALQRHATDAHLSDHIADPSKPLFTRAAASGKRVAVVGAGPAGLACAHRLAMLGHDVTLYDDKPKLGGLNEYGLATYKTVDGFAQREIDWLLSIGGIQVKTLHCLGRDIYLDALVRDFDAVFLGLGLAGVKTIGIAETAGAQTRAAVEFIAELRQAASPADVSVGRRVLVIGGGMTAVDAAVQSRLLGAEEVTMVYRRGPEGLSASGYEQQWAKTNGVRIRHWLAPQEVLHQGSQVRGMRFARTRLDGERLVETDEDVIVEADVVLRAIGQTFVPAPLGLDLTLQNGRIDTDADGRTSHPKVWAGGDCRCGGRDLTVEAVEHGKVAAIAIDRMLRIREVPGDSPWPT